MEELFFHPRVVHVPIALGVLMPLVAGGVLLAWRKTWISHRAWFLAVTLQGILLVSGIVALRTGEAEEERVEKVVAERYIEEHEEAAEVFVWASGGVFAVMLATAALRSHRLGLPLAAAATLGTLGVLGLGYRTGASGGALVYEHGAASAYVGAKGVHPTTTDDGS